MFSYKKGNFPRLEAPLEATNLENNISYKTHNINSDWIVWKDWLFAAVNDYIPTKPISNRSTPPRITSDIIHLI